MLYINTSTELWDPYAAGPKQHPTEKTLYWRHMNVRRMVAGWKDKGPTAVIEHGANPGLISHFTKQGLIDIGNASLADKKFKAKAAAIIADLIATQQFNHLAQKLGVKVIHCSERDTQITDKPKQVDEFVNTWSIEGFREEGTTTAEMGWGTHEKELPPHAYRAQGRPEEPDLPRAHGHQHLGPLLGAELQHPRHGRPPRRGLHHLRQAHRLGRTARPVYRPTVHYAYCPCDAAIASLNEMRGYDYKLNDNQRIMNDEITSGADILGALIMGHPYNSWWIGSDLSIEESRRLVPHQNATTMQVAISVVAATMWMIENPARASCVPDDLPHDFVLEIAKPYLGKWISKPSDWTPLKHYRNTFPGYNKPDLDLKDPWQFKNFLVKDGE